MYSTPRQFRIAYALETNWNTLALFFYYCSSYLATVESDGLLVWPQGFLKFLRQFPRIRFAEVEFSCDAPNPNSEYVIRWKWGPQGTIHLFAQKGIPSSDDEGECSLVDKTYFWHHVKMPFSEHVLKDETVCLVRLNEVSGESVTQNFC